VSIGEFAVGASVADTVRMFRGYQRYSLGRELALFAGRLQARLPFTMGENDLWIAATALARELPLVSRDQAFAAVPGLTVIQY
jgi:predicted nucleic acid-binding protein